MSVTHKTAALVLATLIMMWVGVTAVSRVTVLDAFETVEAQTATDHVRRVQEAFNRDLAAFTILGQDWSNWDDAYQFVESPSEQFIKANLHGSGFAKIGVDIMLFFDTAGTLVQSAAFDRHTGAVSSLPDGLIEQFAPGSPLLRSDDQVEPVAGILSLSGQLLKFAALPIFNSEFTGPSHGTIVLGKLFDDEIVRKMSETVHLDIAITRLADVELGSPVQLALAKLEAGQDAVVTAQSDEMLAAYGLIKDGYGNPALLVTVDLPRTIYSQGQDTLRYFLIALAAIGGLILAVVLIALRLMVLGRLQRLAAQVRAIGRSADLGARVTQAGSDELAGFARVLNQTLDALERAEEQLRVSEARNRALVTAIPDAMITFTKGGTLVDCKSDATGRFGRFCPQSKAGSLADTLPGEIACSFTESAAKAFETGRFQSFEFKLPAQEGDKDTAAAEYETRVVRSGEDEVVAIVRDVTERRQLEEARHNEVLLREIHHRVKNNLQVISSLLSLQSEKLTEPGLVDLFRDSQNRVKTMALIHEKLYRSQDMDGINLGEYLRDLVAFLANSYRLRSNGTNIVVDAPDVQLGLEKAVSCGLIVNELVSNALKHAFPDQRSGSIVVRLAGDRGEGLELTVADDGVGLPKGVHFDETDTLGLRLVRSLADQLDGAINVQNGRGTMFRLTFPIK